MDRGAERHHEVRHLRTYAVRDGLGAGDGDGGRRGRGAERGQVGGQHRPHGLERVLAGDHAGDAELDQDHHEGEQRKDDDDGGEGGEHGLGFAGGGHVEEQTEDVEGQERHEGDGDRLGDHGAELQEAALEDVGVGEDHAETDDEGEDERTHHVQHRGDFDHDVGLELMGRLAHGIGGVGGDERRKRLHRDEVTQKAGEKGGGVGEGDGGEQHPSGTASGFGDGRCHKTENDERYHELDELVEHRRKGVDAPYNGSGGDAAERDAENDCEGDTRQKSEL